MKPLLILAFLVLSVQPVTHSQQAGTVYIYMPHHTWTSGRFSGKLYVDEKRTAEISKNRYCVLRLPAGSHSFYVRDKKLGGLVLDVQDSGTYYVRVNVDEGGYRVKFRGLSEVPKQEAEFILKEIKPIKAKDIYDKTFVDMTLVSSN